MDTLVLEILKRRSVRSFTTQAVTRDQIRDLLKAAMAAPSAAAADPWHFIVITNPGSMARLAEGLPHGQMLVGARVAVVVCGDMERAHRRQLSYLLQDCSAATENLLLAGSMMNLGGCWIGVHPDPARVSHVRRLFGLPQTIVPVAAVAIGHPAKLHAPRTRYRQDAVHMEVW